MDGHRGTPYRTIEVSPYSPHVGAEIGGIDLTRPLPLTPDDAAGAHCYSLANRFG